MVQHFACHTLHNALASYESNNSNPTDQSSQPDANWIKVKEEASLD